jgi:hypothetical protein
MMARRVKCRMHNSVGVEEDSAVAFFHQTGQIRDAQADCAKITTRFAEPPGDSRAWPQRASDRSITVLIAGDCRVLAVNAAARD